MNRVAIHLWGSAAVDRDAICGVFRDIQHSGGRVVALAQDYEGSDRTLHELLNGLGEDFDQLFSLVGDELYEWLPEGEDVPQAMSPSGHVH